jgi:predicted nuclease with TOPRIM domain
VESQQELLPEYKSPKHKLVRFFARSRDAWKDKYQERVYETKILRNRMSYLENSKESWKRRAEEAEKENTQLRAELKTLAAKPQVEKKKGK